jgi:hypothetical protein
MKTFTARDLNEKRQEIREAIQDIFGKRFTDVMMKLEGKE